MASGLINFFSDPVNAVSSPMADYAAIANAERLRRIEESRRVLATQGNTLAGADPGQLSSPDYVTKIRSGGDANYSNLIAARAETLLNTRAMPGRAQTLLANPIRAL